MPHIVCWLRYRTCIPLVVASYYWYWIFYYPIQFEIRKLLICLYSSHIHRSLWSYSNCSLYTTTTSLPPTPPIPLTSSSSPSAVLEPTQGRASSTTAVISFHSSPFVCTHEHQVFFNLPQKYPVTFALAFLSTFYLKHKYWYKDALV